MRKTFKSVIIAISIVCMGGVVTSCGDDNDGGLFGGIINIIQNLFNTGESYTYTGVGTAYTMTGSSETAQWQLVNAETTSFNNAQTVLTIGNNTGTLTLPNLTDGKVTFKDVVIYNLALNNEDASKTRFDFGENTSIDGSIVIDGTTYSAANLYIEQEKTYVTTTNIALEFSIYFDDNEDGDYSKVVNFTYEGVAEATE